MSASATFECGTCRRKIPWRKEIAGKQGKCKCGELLLVPAELTSADDGLYDLSELAADAERAAADLPPTIVEVARPPQPKTKTRTKPAAGGVGAPRPPILTKPDRDSTDVFFDKQRDFIVPIVLSLLGAALILGFYAVKLNLGPAALTGVSIGLAIIIAFEAAILIGFALAVAGPLGVSFGDLRTAWYKFAAIAVFCDGVTLWVDSFIHKISGGFGGGILGFGLMGLITAIFIYWSTMVYLFSMDPGDAKMVVAVLSIFYRVCRLILIFVILPGLLNMAGIKNTGMVLPSPAEPPNSQRDSVDEANDLGLLFEARAYLTKYGRLAETGPVEGWYAAGAKNVWYQVSRDINGHGLPYQFVIELPQDPAGRAKCFAIAHDWYDHLKMYGREEMLHDDHDPFLMVELARSR